MFENRKNISSNNGVIFTAWSVIVDDLEDKSKRRTDYSDTDENGNRRLECAPLLSSQYRSMREPPGSPYFKAAFDTFQQYSVGSNTRDLDDSTTTANQEANKKTRKKPKKDKTVVTERKSDDIENYQGGKELDEILSFIENDGTGRKPKKITNSNSLDISSSKATDRNNKKNKERKPKVTPIENKPTTEKRNSEIKESTESVENSETSKSHLEMGNSNEKLCSEDIETTDCQKNISEKNHIIAENCVEKDIKPEGEMMKGDVISCEEKESVGSLHRKSTTEDAKMGGELINQKVGRELINHRVDMENPTGAKHGLDQVIKDPKSDTDLNNVKQNNLKNSKKKQSSTISDNDKKDTDNAPAVKEVETKSVEETVEFKTNVMVDAEEMDRDGDYYIFTDLDLPKPVEEEFQVVGKKKKKGATVIAKETQSKDPTTAPRVPIREERRRPQRSVTPPPSSSMVNSLSMEAERNKMRDLSPSSFPALTGGRQSFRDGRRSSTGDVPKEILIKPQDDSDLESVKSLPASAQAVSPRLQISYAKMAASPKPNSSMSTSHGEELEDQTNVSVDLKSAVWKGSLTERRHSIGSSPDGKDNEASSIRQKFGSQELVKPEKEDSLFGSPHLPGSPEKSPSGTETCNSKSSQNSPMDNSAAIDSVSHTVSNISVTQTSDSEFIEPLITYPVNVTPQVTVKNNGASSRVSSKHPMTKSSSCEPSKPSKSQVLSKQKGIVRKQAKSVVFLDRSERDHHQSLDIVFGFDPQLEGDVEVSNSVSSLLSQTRSSASVNCDNSNEITPNPVIHSKSVPNNSSKDLKHSQRNSKSASFPLEGKNGVKSMSTLILSSNSKSPSAQMFSFISEDTCGPSLSSGGGPGEEGCVTVCYGEECGAVLGAESKQPSRQLKYKRENGDILGCFNRNEVTNFLMRG